MLQEKTLAILGAGMMGGALARGLVHAGAMPAANIRLYDVVPSQAERVAAELGSEAQVAPSVAEAVAGADLILLAVKPQVMLDAVSAITPSLHRSQITASIAPGITVAKLESILPDGIPVIRAMPNMPALVGMGMTALCRGTYANDADLELARALFSAVGETVAVEERLLDAVTGLSGSGPAYVYLIIEALTDGGVRVGLPRETARHLAAQTVLGAAQVVLTSDEHPAQLKDSVTTPGGTTIAALSVLERAGIRAALMDAVEASANRSKELSGG
ncbi:MAG: pyrroline-5-carboxylate reductase [Armatimonadetes bacterium]|nr:pyrroline-5-carboxylate reductase [Armatimonadota bacterium]